MTYKIVRAFPNPFELNTARVVRKNDAEITIDIGKDRGIIPGLHGFVAQRDIVKIEHDKDIKMAVNYNYLAKFVVLHVFDKTSIGYIYNNPKQSIEPEAKEDGKVKKEDGKVKKEDRKIKKEDGKAKKEKIVEEKSNLDVKVGDIILFK